MRRVQPPIRSSRVTANRSKISHHSWEEPEQSPLIPASTAHNHDTRSTSRLSGSDRLRYGQRYHPLDEVTRPAAAKRRKMSLGISIDTDHADSYDTDAEDGREESIDGKDEVPTRRARELKKRPGRVSVAKSDDADDDDDDDNGEPVRPNLRGKRSSMRLSQTGPINYSTQVHPQDRALRKSGVSLTGLNAARPKKGRHIVISVDDDTVDEDDQRKIRRAKRQTLTKDRTKKLSNPNHDSFDDHTRAYVRAWEDLAPSPLPLDGFDALQMS